MKKKYLFITIIGLLFLTGCGSKNKLTCTKEEKDDTAKTHTKMEVKYTFDKDDKFEEANLLVTVKNTGNEKLSQDELDQIEDSEEFFCNLFSSEFEAGAEFKKCDVSYKNNTLTIKVDGIKSTEASSKTKAEVKESMTKQDGTTCK